ncbi:MAG: DNA-binding response regulator [Allomuricauda sp.]|nr:MAG: DNA-binding response regulator [Allomuricauda sp.]
MKCIIIDDEAAARAIIAQFCSRYEEFDVVREFDNALDALKFLNQNSVDLIFLDIHMPGFSGIDFVQSVQNPPKIVMTTSCTEFGTSSYEYDAIVDYLVKPIHQERFDKCIEKIKRSMNLSLQKEATANARTSDNLYINIDRRLIKLNYNEILLIEAKGDYINIKTENKEYLVHTTLKKIKDKLHNDSFLQIHRSYIINFNKIIDIEDNSVLIKSNVIPISRSNRPELMKRLNLL